MVPSLETEKLSLPVPESEKLITSPSSSVAVEVEMVVPVAVFSEKDAAANVVFKSIGSLMSVIEKVNSEVAEVEPSDAVKVNE